MKHLTLPIICLLLLANITTSSGNVGYCRNNLPEQHIVSLTAESTGWSTELYWNARFDQDMVSYAVERSSNGINYFDIISNDHYFLAAGDTESFREQDNNPVPGENFYRIRFTFANGEQFFSERRKLFFKEVPAFEIFPNPTGRQVNLLMKKFWGQEVEVQIFDGIGAQVFHQYIPAVDEGLLRIELDNSMSAGIYAVSVMHQGKTYTRRLVVTRTENN